MFFFKKVSLGFVAHFFDSLESEFGGEFGELHFDVPADVLKRGEEAAHQIPDSDRELPGDGSDGDVSVGFTQDKLPSPSVQRAGWLIEGILSRLDEEGAQVGSSVSGEAPLPADGGAAVVDRRAQSEVSDKFFVAGETVDVADDGRDGEGHDVADSHDADQLQNIGIAESFAGHDGAQFLAALFGSLEFFDHLFEENLLHRLPGAESFDSGERLVAGQ